MSTGIVVLFGLGIAVVITVLLERTYGRTAVSMDGKGEGGEVKTPAQRLPVITTLMRGKPFTRGLQRKLIAAGILLHPSEFMVLVLISVTVAFFIGAALAKSLLLALGLGFAGYMGPFMLLGFIRKKRLRTLEAQLADALTVIASSLKAGHSFLRGAEMSSKQMPPPIADELKRVIKLVNLGMPAEQALVQMGERVQSYDFDIMITATSIQLQTGGNLVEVLESIANTIRERINIRGEMSAATAQARLSGIVLMLLPVGMGFAMMMMNRQYASLLFTTDIGHIMLKVAAGMQITGCLVIRKMLQFEG